MGLLQIMKNKGELTGFRGAKTPFMAKGKLEEDRSNKCSRLSFVQSSLTPLAIFALAQTSLSSPAFAVDLSYSCASGCTVTESDPDGGSSVNKTALFSRAGGIGTVGTAAINMRATITAQTGAGVHSFGTFFNAPSITSNLSGDNVIIRWDILDASDNSTAVLANDIYVGFADIDGPNNETVSFDCSDTSLVELSLDQATDLTWSQSGNIITFAGQNNYNGGAESIVAGRWKDVTTFTMQRSANSGYILAADGDRSFNFTNIVQYDCGDFFKDFGDAPINYGEATHENPPNKPQLLYLGVNAPDTEDTTPLGGDAGVGADGDDGNGINDDEDGIASIPLIHDETVNYSVDVSCTGTGTVSAWIDFNGNNLFDTGERNSNFPVSCSNQTTALTWTNLTGLSIGDTYLRVRFASTELDATNPTGNAVDGEVEDYALTIKGHDYGDAPNDLTSLDASLSNIYNVLIADSAASHVVDSTIRMGASIDSESDGQPSVNGDAEGTDDDGVTFVTAPDGKSILYMNEANDITINVSVDGVLSAWFDWNEDGDWDDAGEQIANDQVVTAGNNILTVTTSNLIPQGSKYARFRFCTTAGQCNTPGGVATDGEVEDYKIDYLAYRDTGSQCNALTNGSFELPVITANQNDENTVPGWATIPDQPNLDTFANRNSIELWSDGFLGVPSQQGNQIAEINAFVSGTLYQDVALTPGTTVEWSLWHRGRDGTDSMNVLMGTPAEVLSQVASTVQGTLTSDNTAWHFYSGTYTVPAGQYVTRFGFHSLSTSGGNQSAGNLIDNISLGITCHDYGDAPDSYHTSNANNGAYHQLVDTPVIYIGGIADKELDGNPGVAADGDDSNDTDDEDGVSAFATLSNQASNYSVDVTVTNNAGKNSNLVGWIDFDGNGQFDNTEAATVVVPDGSNNAIVTLNWTNLSGLQPGDTYLRLRLTTDRNIATGDPTTSLPEGVAADGEIEDYPLTIKRELLPFVCDGTPYTAIDDPSVLQSVDRNTLAVTSLGNLNPAVNINGIGYNAMDNLIYGFYTGNGSAGNTGINVGNIIRYGSGNYIEDLGLPTGSGNFDPYIISGTMDNSGKMYAINDSALFIIDVGTKPVPGTLTYTRVARTGTLLSSSDITFGIYDDALYGVRDNQLIRISKTGVGTIVATTGDLLTSAGGAWSAADGSLYFYDNGSGKLFKVDVSQSPAVVSKVGDLAANGKFDATACTPPSLLKDASVTETQAGEAFTYTYTIANAFNFPITVGFSDTLPATLTYDLNSLSNNTPGGGSVGTFNASLLTINGIGLAANSQVSFTVAVNVSSAINTEQDIDNQAYLSYESGNIKSDDPDTGAIEDPTRVHVLPVDHGDAPDAYGDAAHGVPSVTTVYMGAIKPDVDADSQNAANGGTDGTGDDDDGTDDEDGISAFPKLTDIDSTYELDVVVTNTSGNTTNLVGWIDFNGNNSFDADEAATLPVSTGASGVTVKLTWAIPASIVAGDVYARIRFTTDTAIATGTANTSVATGVATDGEVEDYPITIEVGGFPVKGRVYIDANVDGANDIGESGVSGLPVVLLDITNNTCVSAKTDADGNYVFFPVVPGDYRLYEASRETVSTPQNCDVALAKDPAGYRSTTANALAQFSVIDAEITGKDFGDVKDPLFTPDNSGTVLPGNVVYYAHKFTPKSTGTVNFTSNNSGGATTGWSNVIYQDTDCNGKLDGAEGNAPVAANLATIAEQDICLINKVFAPVNVSAGEAFTNAINADFDFNGNALAGSITLKVTDLTKAANDSVQGTSKLELVKQVENITQNTGTTETQNQAKPGDVLKYYIHYSNTGTGPITDLKVNDMVPEFTQLQGGSVVCDSTPSGLGCTPDVSNEPEIHWIFNGTLEGGTTGSVSYQVQIE